MAFIYYNPNPMSRIVGDCAVRAISKALDIDWELAYAKEYEIQTRTPALSLRLFTQ